MGLAVGRGTFSAIEAASPEERCFQWLQKRGYIARNELAEIEGALIPEERKKEFLEKFQKKVREEPDKVRMPVTDLQIFSFILNGGIWIEDIENDLGIDPDALRLLRRDFCLSRGVACIQFSPETTKIVISEPWDVSLSDEVARQIASTSRCVFIGAPEKTIKTILHHHWPQGYGGDRKEFLKWSGNPATAISTEEYSDYLVDRVIQTGLSEKASDIHIEPLRDSGGFSVQMRIDGRLYSFENLGSPSDPIEPIVARIKNLGGMLIQELRVPQDGGFTRGSGSMAVDCRVATLPSVLGWGKEKVVIRLLRPIMEESLNTLGFNDDELDAFRHLVSCPNGIILATGPTGSGKTTTLHCTLQEYVRRNEYAIYTIEDPVEYRLPGAHQIQVIRNVLEFPRAFRSILRADPDIVMVGELRDAETVHVALQASITGHLVFSTLHTNDATSVVHRLLAMRDEAFPVEPYLVASALRGAVAQRLIETLCPHCKVERKLLQEESDLLDLPPDTIIYDINPHGCEHCKHRGINGRTAVFEIADFRKVDRWEELVHQRVSNSEYRKACIDSGMVTLFEAAKRKLVEGSVYPKSVYDTFGFLAFGEQVQEKLRKKH